MDEVGWSVLIIAVLALVSLFFSLNSLSLRSFSRVKLQEAFRSRGKEQLFDTLVDDSETLIFACSSFRILANAGILIMLAVLFARRHYILAFVIAVVVYEVFTLAIPHSWSKHTGERILARTYPILKFFARLAWPVLALLRLHDGLVQRLAGVTEATGDEAMDQKQEEILSVVEEGMMEGVVDEEEVEMIENVLELGDTTAQEIMTPRTDVVAVNADDDLESILKTISKAGHSRIPVYEDNIDNVVGLVYAKDLLAQIGRDPKDFKLRDTIRPAYFVPETKPLDVLLHEFQNQKLHIAIVLDEYGGTAGIVTIEDILEELVGEITDEYEKPPAKAMKKLNESTAEIDARMYIDDLNSEFDISLPEEEDYDTVGGFVFSHLGYIPKSGENFEYENVKFSIVAAEARRIKRIRLQKLQAEQNKNQ